MKSSLNKIKIISCFIVLALLPGIVKANYINNAWTELAILELGKYLPDTLISKEAFLKTAVTFLSFEKGEDPLFLASKQNYSDNLELEAFITRDEALMLLFKIINISPEKKPLEVAKRLGICEFEAGSNNYLLSAKEAAELITKTREAWYREMESEAEAESFNAAYYFYTSSFFKFSNDETKLLFDELGSPAVINLADMTKVSYDQALFKTPELETYPVKEGEIPTCVYDNNGVLRVVTVEVAKRFNLTTEKYILYREGEDFPFEKIIEFDLSLTRDYEVVGFSPDNKKLYVKTNFYDNYVTLYEIDPVSLTRKVIYQNPRADVAVELTKFLMGMQMPDLRDPKTGKLLATYYVDDKLRLVVLDDKLADIINEVTKKAGEYQYPVLVTSDYIYLLLKHLDDRDLGTYSLYNTKTGLFTEVSKPVIPTNQIAHSYPVSFKASDGATVYGYLTIPLGKSPQNLPFLINAHGGPTLRFSWTPNPQTLLAANLGIAVLSVNFRFSLGFGNEYTDAASRDKLLAQKDILDATKWAIKIGIADPKRIGIMGHSYGGYSSFYQAATHPELYKVAIPQMGIWDWTDLGDELVQQEVVPASHLCVAPLPYTELARVMSPSSFADRLKAPILIVYSGLDQAVYPSQNIMAINKLTELGNPPEVLFLPDDPHSPASIESFVMMFEAMQDFLIKNFLN